MIKLDHIHFLRSGRVILEDVTLQMEEGQQWIICGKNGSGKTTILEMITGYLFPSSGTVEVLGYKFGSCNITDVRKKIGYISPNLFEKLSLSDPVLEVVATGEFGYLRFYEPIPEGALEKAGHILDFLGIAHLKDQPLGRLSQGERKKVLLARALISDPTVLIMDEPCAGLDPEEREKFLVNIEKLAKRNIQMIYVTHHLEEIMPCFTHAALLKEGKLIAAGEKKDVITPELLTRTYNFPFNIRWHADRPFWTPL